ncbi:hypothetical protein Tco_1564307 [Tanacetum coccineum]
MPPEDHVFPAEEQPLPAVVSPTADSPGYIPESDPEEDPEDEEDPEEDPAYYPADIGDDDEEDEEEEHLAPADSTVVALPAVDPSPPPSPVPTLYSLSHTHHFPKHHLHHLPKYYLHLLALLVLRFPRVVYLLGRGLVLLLLPLLFRAREDLYKFVDMVDDAPRHPGCPISRELDYGITDEWDGLVKAIEEIAPTTIEGVNRNITDLSTTFDQETTIMHGLMEDARDDVDTMETRVRDTERRMMAALEVVNLRVTYQVDVRSRESSEFYSRHHDAQKDRATVRAEIEVLRRERLAYEQESMETRQALARSKAYSRALEAWVTVLETQARRHEWQRQDADDRATRHIMRIQALEAGARDDTLEDTGSSA